MTTNRPPDARNARIYVATANVAVMDILSGNREHAARQECRKSLYRVSSEWYERRETQAVLPGRPTSRGA